MADAGETKKESSPPPIPCSSYTDCSVPATNSHTLPQEMLTQPNAERRIWELERELASKTTQLEARQTENTAQKSHIMTLSNRLSAAQTELEELQSSILAATSQRNDGDILGTLRYENSVLKKQANETRRQRQDFSKAKNDSLRPPVSEIQEEFDKIKVDVAGACSSLDITTTLPADIDVTESDNISLGQWAQRVTQCSYSQFLASALSNGVSELQVIRSLSAVGLCELVFESPVFSQLMAMESPLLDQYRKQIQIQGIGVFFSFFPPLKAQD